MEKCAKPSAEVAATGTSLASPVPASHCPSMTARRKPRSPDEMYAARLTQRDALRAYTREAAERTLRPMAEYQRENGLTVIASILSAGLEWTCPVCTASDGAAYPVDVALRDMLLPHEDCTCVLWRGRRGYPDIVGACSCSWTTEVFADDPDPVAEPYTGPTPGVTLSFEIEVRDLLADPRVE